MKIRVKIDQHSYTVEVGDLNLRPITASVDGETFEVWPEEPAMVWPEEPAMVWPEEPATVWPVARPPAAPVHRPAAGAVTAPIPGTIVSVAVQAGDTVTPGQELLVLEAMKMKNIIRATHAAIITGVAVQPGDRVTQGQRLLELGG